MTKTDSIKTFKCDWCSSQTVKIHRRYKGEAYCTNCYKTWFVKKPCSRCQRISRLHRKDDFPVCHDCQRKQPCIRCSGDAYKNGANTEYGRVCQVCYQNYFKEKKTCQVCGEKKPKISRYTELPHNLRICSSCYQNQTCSTCVACQRYRKVIETPNGLICQKCHDLGEIDCPCCGQKMPAGQGNKCWDCYWRQRLEKEVELNLHLFKSDDIKSSYKAFIVWFVDSTDNQNVTLKHLIFTEFFETCDKLWNKIPSYEALVREFKPEGLRHHLTVLRWLIDTRQVTVDLKVKNEIAERERIAALLNKFEKLPEPIESYYKFLNEKLSFKKTSLKSVRLALQPAVDIYIRFSINGQQWPLQEHLDTYLREKHGQYNAIYGFISHINREYGSTLEHNKPSLEIIRRDKKKKLEKELMFLNQISKPTVKDYKNWLRVGLEYFHDLKLNKKILNELKIVQTDQKIVVYYNSNEYTVPALAKYETTPNYV